MKRISPGHTLFVQAFHGLFIFAVALVLHSGSSVYAQTSAKEKGNLLKNFSFEDGQAGWDFNAWNKRGTVVVDTAEFKEGKSSVRIENAAGDDSFLKQTIAVKPKTRYRLTGYIKIKDVVTKGPGATLSLEGGFEKTESMTGKKGWTKVSFEFDSGASTEIKVGPRLGHYSSPAMGVAWYDDLELEELGPSRKR